MPRFLRACLALSSAAFLSALVPAARAGTATGTFQVTATVVSSCSVSGTLLNFGSGIDPLAAAVPLDASSTLSVVCTNTTPYAVALNAGANAGGASNFGSRPMISNGHLLGYQLYRDSGRSSVWGDGTGVSSTATGTGTGSTQSLTICGRLPALSGVIPGSDTDTVTVTVTS